MSLSLSAFETDENLGTKQPMFDDWPVDQPGEGVRDHDVPIYSPTWYPVDPDIVPVHPITPVNPVEPAGPSITTPPAWAIGTFYSSNVKLTISANGIVTVVNSGVSYSGTYVNGLIWLNGDTSTISQLSNGVRTYNQNSGQTTDYSLSPPASITPPAASPPVDTLPAGNPPVTNPTVPIPPVSNSPAATTPASSGEIEIDSNMLLIGGAVVAAIFLLK